METRTPRRETFCSFHSLSLLRRGSQSSFWKASEGGKALAASDHPGLSGDHQTIIFFYTGGVLDVDGAGLPGVAVVEPVCPSLVARSAWAVPGARTGGEEIVEFTHGVLLARVVD